MKKLILLAIIVISTSTAFAQKIKLAHVNTDTIAAQLAVKDSVEMKFQQYQMKVQQELQYEQQRLAQDQAQFEKTYLTLDSNIVQREYKRLQADQAAFQQETVPQLQAQVQAEQRKLLMAVEGKIEAAVKKIGKANGYTYVLDINAALYAAGTDITELVKQELGL
ncbi:MAG: outer membrane protein [Flavobacteriales bacterium]|jgi:outer membrane protein|tara:strand:- start:12735 stop:13229 length:495 start_codon:yes stop_codon:yes gene_type:complete